MKQIYGWILFTWLAFEQIIKINTNLYCIASLLGALCLFMIKEKFFDKTYAAITYLAAVIALAQFYPDFIVLAGIPLCDLMFVNGIPLSVSILLGSSYFAYASGNFSDIFYLVSSGIFGYITGVKSRNERVHLDTLDEERRLRYNLEKVKNELMNSRHEIERMTEIRERNRIAHEIHDNIGHSIAGVIFQLEGARRVIKKDIPKTEEILKLCSDKLSEALELTRNTVHNIKSDKKIGLEAIQKIINDFKFCPIEFQHTGDFNNISISNQKILEANIMEFLTNAAKYSRATSIQIKIDTGKRNIRLFYKDNGIGCKNIKESLGISGMRSRVANTGGTISIDGSDGFLVVCNLPVGDKYDGEDGIF